MRGLGKIYTHTHTHTYMKYVAFELGVEGEIEFTIVMRKETARRKDRKGFLKKVGYKNGNYISCRRKGGKC